MSQTIADERVAGPLPTAFRWLLASPIPPTWLGLGVGAASFGIGLAITGTSDALVVTGQASYALYWVWIPLALSALVRGTARDVEALRPALPPGPGAGESLREEVFRGGGRSLPAGVAVGIGVAVADLWLFARLGVVARGPAPYAYIVVRELVLCIAMFAILGWALGAARSLSRAAGERARVELLDPNALAPLGHSGARLALWWLLMIGISLIILLSPAASGRLVVALGAYMLGFAAMAAVAVAVPGWGAHQALARAKAAELAKVRAELRQSRESGEAERIAGLVAWEQRIAAVSEWPIDARSLRRTALYPLIPVCSWIAGALVERAVDALLP